MKEYMCVQVGHHLDIARAIDEWQRKGWRLHTHQATGERTWVVHYLLFEKGE